MSVENKKVMAVVNDLFFGVKIGDAAKRAGLSIEFVKQADLAIAKAAEGPAMIVVDLNYDAVRPIDLISELKAKPELAHVPVIGYLSHVQTELKQKAEDAGCDVVLARSAFSQNLPQILARYGGAASQPS